MRSPGWTWWRRPWSMGSWPVASLADFGFSQEFAEYRAYVPGDDLRHVDWNVYARSDRAYIKRFHGETKAS